MSEAQFIPATVIISYGRLYNHSDLQYFCLYLAIEQNKGSEITFLHFLGAKNLPQFIFEGKVKIEIFFLL